MTSGERFFGCVSLARHSASESSMLVASTATYENGPSLIGGQTFGRMQCAPTEPSGTGYFQSNDKYKGRLGMTNTEGGSE